MMFSDFPSISSIGIALAVLGIALLGLAVLFYLLTPSEKQRSFLAPTLGFDALDPDLQDRYLLSRDFDRILPKVGREIRRTLFVIQAMRFSGTDHDPVPDLDHFLNLDHPNSAEIETFRRELQRRR